MAISRPPSEVDGARPLRCRRLPCSRPSSRPSVFSRPSGRSLRRRRRGSSGGR
ncbi:hypothetical protein ACFFX0_08430 [Citricoccus parietis]|uniref:Uncharacterized protein n=1 Tax=Citricoccus parietis TaxID=592307 RepID=A0ABV5FX05_9MICC